jgi:hypothetical protein
VVLRQNVKKASKLLQIMCLKYSVAEFLSRKNLYDEAYELIMRYSEYNKENTKLLSYKYQFVNAA